MSCWLHSLSGPAKLPARTAAEREECAGVLLIPFDGVKVSAIGGGGSGVIGLPSLQAIDRAQRARIWMASEATDMRCGFDRLAERVKTVIGEDP
jgi:hypothetical protein